MKALVSKTEDEIEELLSEKKFTLLRTVLTDNIGQMKESEAQEHIDRLTKQDGRNWRKDYSDQMYVKDETDPYMHNPIKREKGYVFVTCTQKVD